MPLSKSEIRAKEALLHGGVGRNLPVLTELLTHLSVERVVSWDTHEALIHSLRRVFTALHHGGMLEGSRDGGENDRELCKWLRSQFFAFLGLLVRLLVEGKSGEGEARVEGRVLALTTTIHFLAHAAPLAQQALKGGPRLCQGVTLWLMRQMLTAGGEGSADLYASAREGPLTPSLTCSLTTATTTFRSQFVDDYDDVRLSALRALREVCAEKRRSGSGGSGGGGGPKGGEKKKDKGGGTATTNSMGGEALSHALVEACHPHAFARNAVDFLLSISLPSTQKEWDSVPRTSWGEEQLGKLLEPLKGRGGGEKQDTTAAAAAAAPAKPSQVKYLRDSDDEGEEEEEKEEEEGGQQKEKSTGISEGGNWNEQRSAFGDALLGLLQLPLPTDVYRRILVALPKRILPMLPPRIALQLSDFLTDACDKSGAAALLALESLFFLMQKHGLEYPRFYARLYTLLGSPATHHAKYRGKFLALLDNWMASPALPAYLAAAFAKRALRVALTAPVGMALWALPFTYNLIKRHTKALHPLVHRGATAAATVAASHSSSSSSSSSAVTVSWPTSADPFLPSVDDPSQSRALESSLWEIMVLSQHAFAPVAHAARVLLGETNRDEYSLSEGGLGESTYAPLISQELTRSVKKGGGEGGGGGSTTSLAPVAFSFAAGGGGGGASTTSLLSWPKDGFEGIDWE